MKERNIGSSFDDFLEEEGLLTEAEEAAIKRVFAYEIKQMMEAKKLTKTAMARRMKTSRSALDRLLDPRNESVTLQTMKKAAVALGRTLRIEMS